MLKITTNCFAVIYIPFYALQCARQKRLLEKTALDKRSLDQLSLNMVEAEFPKVREPGLLDDSSSNYLAALLDQDGMHVIELNHAAEFAGVQTGMSTSQALARASNLVLYKRNPSSEQHLQDS